MRSLTAAVAVAAAGFLVAACGGDKDNSSPSSSAATGTSKAPIAQAALANLLLTPAEVDAAMGTTGMTTREKFEKLGEDVNKRWPPECLYAYNPGETPVYAGSGNTGAVGRVDAAPPAAPGSRDMDPEATQYLIVFPSATEAKAFFDTSAKAWQACSDRPINLPADETGPEINWKLGPAANTNGVLSITVSVSINDPGGPAGGTCQRALTVRNNLVIDVSGCGPKDPGDAGVKLVNQLAGKVDKG